MGWGTEPRPPIAVYDACVLHPAPLRDLLVRLALAGAVRARWTDRILDECFHSVLRRRPELSAAHLDRTRTLMNRALPEALVSHEQDLPAGLVLPDPDDHHVVAAAAGAGASLIVSFNLKDFPADQLRPLGLLAISPDDLVWRLVEVKPSVVVETLRRQVAALRAPPVSLDDLLTLLSTCGLARSVEAIRLAPTA